MIIILDKQRTQTRGIVDIVTGLELWISNYLYY